MLVVIEGIDGSGKGTQAQMLLDRARAEGWTAALLSFPQYQNTASSQWIAEYLKGDFGGLAEGDPLFAGMLFALDRFESKEHIKGLLAKHDLVIMDRYVASNLAYQSARITEVLPTQFVARLLKLEYEIYELPRPDLTVFLDMPVSFSAYLVSKRGPRAYTAEDDIKMGMTAQIGIPREGYDIHEENTDYLHAVHKMYYHLIESCDIEPCEVINCQDEAGELRDREDIAREIWSVAEAQLKAGPVNPADTIS